jgi:hypothetical protein
MTLYHSNKSRESDPHALPNIEVFHVSQDQVQYSAEPTQVGWYWWPCFPGCLPDGDPNGPFTSEAEALADAQEPCEDNWGNLDGEGL